MSNNENKQTDASAQEPQRQSNQGDRFARTLSQRGARPVSGQNRTRPNESPKPRVHNATNRTPMARNPRLDGSRPVVSRPANTAPRRPQQSAAQNAANIQRRRFSVQNENRMSRPQVDRPQGQPQARVIGRGSKKLRIIPLGGAGEVGDRNMTLFEYGNDILVIDCGIAFAKKDMLGIDALIPDTRYLEERKQNIRGMVFTHGHEDHIGSVAYIWPKLGCPMYATPLTSGLIKHKFKEAGIENAPLNVVEAGDKLHFGQISVEMVRLTHSIPDVLGLAIRCPAGLFFYATDWRLEHTPALGQPADWQRVAELGAEGITALFSDSTNVDRPGYSPSEKMIGDAFDRIFRDAPGRIIVAQFASQINRIQQVLSSARRYGKKVALSGRSMETYVNIAMGLGYLKIPEGMLVDLRKVNTVDPKKLVILSTGSQGEEFSSLQRIAGGEHRHVKLDKTDTVVISASTIPGNDAAVDGMVDNLYREGANVIHNKTISDIHVSGHPSRDELKMMFALTQPRYFIPIHGDYHRMVEHGKLAVEMGVDEKNIVIMENGNVVEFDEKGGRVTSEKIQLEDIMIDGLGIGDVGPIVIRERQTLGNEGMVTIFMVVKHKSGEMVTSPDIISRGFIYMRQAEDLMHKLREFIKQSYAKAQKKHGTNWDEIKADMRNDVSQFLYQATGRNPMILPVITTVS